MSAPRVVTRVVVSLRSPGGATYPRWMNGDGEGLVALATAVVQARAAIEIGVPGAEDRMTEAYTRLVGHQQAEGMLQDALDTTEELLVHRRKVADGSLESLLQLEQALELREALITGTSPDAYLALSCRRELAQVRERLAALDPVHLTGCVVTLLELGTALHERGEHREVRGVATQAAALSRGVPDPLDRRFLETEALTLQALSMATSRRRRVRQEALDAATAAVEASRSERTLWALASALHAMDRDADALAVAEEALSLPERSRDPAVHADLLRLRGTLAMAS
jgi:tetratricopeptide (TPR) repeat protein